MKKIFVLLAVLLLFAAPVMAEEILIEYSYDDQGQDSLIASGYQIRYGGTDLCEVPIPNPDPDSGALESTCVADAVPPGTYDFTIRAILPAGQFSPWSAPYSFEVPPDPLAPAVIRIQFNR